MTGKVIKGSYEVENGKLSLVCETKNVSFEELEAVFNLIKAEIDRQIANKTLCPYYREPPNPAP